MAGDVRHLRPRRRRRGRLIFAATGLGVAVLLVLAYAAYILVPSPALPQLPNIIGGNVHDISPREITVVDGDTIRARGQTVRLVGFDAPESGSLARCARERELAERATAQLKILVAGGGLKLRMVPCACPPVTEGTPACDFGRACGSLTAYGRDVGATMIQYLVARPYVCGPTSCPPRQSWC